MSHWVQKLILAKIAVIVEKKRLIEKRSKD
jgi:hypothetical protein